MTRRNMTFLVSMDVLDAHFVLLLDELSRIDCTVSAFSKTMASVTAG